MEDETMKIQTTSLNLIEFNHTRPGFFEYKGIKKNVLTWRFLYAETLKILADRYPDTFCNYIGKVILGQTVEIGDEKKLSDFRSPIGIMRKPDGKWLFAETDFNAEQILLRLRKLIETCGEPLDAMAIYFPANLSQNAALCTDKSDSSMIRKSLAEIFQLTSSQSPPAVVLPEQQYMQWLIWKGEKASEAQADFIMAEKVIERLQLSSRRLFSVTSSVELKNIRSALRRTPQWCYFSSRQQNQILHAIDLYREFRESSGKALPIEQAASTEKLSAITSTSYPSASPTPVLSGSKKVSALENTSSISNESKQPASAFSQSVTTPMVVELPRKTAVKQPAEVSSVEMGNTTISLDEKQQRYAELLKDAFPDGFKDGSAIATKKMQLAYQNKYGEEPAESKEEIMTIVQRIGTLRDGRIYPKNQSQLLSEINSEILRLLNAGATCVYCDAVFEHYRERLAEEQHIYNSDALRDPLLDLAHGQYGAKYGAFCLPDRDTDISMDVLLCMRGHHIPATYDDLQQELWYIPLDKIKKALMEDPAIVNVGDGTYFYAPNLPVSKEELRIITSQLESELGYHSYTTTSQLMKLIHEKCPTVEINTEGLSTLTIRNSLSYLLRKNFNFRSNIISSITTQPPVDTKQAFREFCREHETMTTAELQAFADEVNTTIYWDSVFDEMIRISECDWVRKERVQWTPEEIDAKLDEMCEGDYLILKDVCLFLQFPVVGYRWNSFLLESYANSYSSTYKLLHASFSGYDCCGAIVKKSSHIKNYHDLAVDVLANDDAWKDQQSALQTLVDKGLQQRRTLSDIAQVTKEARLKREKRQKEAH